MHVAGYYYVSKMEDGQFRIEDNFVEQSTSVISSFEGKSFFLGERVTVKSLAYNQPETIVGITTDGIITHLDGGGYTFQTSNAKYQNGSVVDVYEERPAPAKSAAAAAPVCFLQGTLIDTDCGVVPIEKLVVGDRILCSSGLRTVKWIGWRQYHATSLRTAEQRLASLPVRILAGALSDNEPSQDLRVSPWHHVYVDGVLIRANDLMNGKSIVQETEIVEFSYYHVELDQFDVIRAHGVYSESWADGGNRDFFQNVDVTSLRPEDKKRRMADRPGFTALRKATDIAVIHDRIAARADTVFTASVLKVA